MWVWKLSPPDVGSLWIDSGPIYLSAFVDVGHGLEFGCMEEGEVVNNHPACAMWGGRSSTHSTELLFRQLRAPPALVCRVYGLKLTIKRRTRGFSMQPDSPCMFGAHLP